MSRRTSCRMQAPREGTLIVAAILWAVGFADVILGATQLGGDYGLWAMAAAGLLLIIGSLVDPILERLWAPSALEGFPR